MTDSVLRAEAVSKRFGGLQVLHDVDIDVRQGQLHSVIGPNGAGKSTLFDMLAGVQQPDAGRIFLRQRDVSDLSLWRRARLGVVRKFQTPSVFPVLTVRDNLRVAAWGRHPLRRLFRSSHLEEHFGDAIGDMGLEHLMGTSAGDLSHGEQQRLEIAMALATKPDVLLLDEPAAGATRPEAYEMARALRRLVQDFAVVVVEHDLRFIREVSDWVTVLDRGRKIAEGDVDTISGDTTVKNVFLGRQTL
jgi:ABC-type uncharacterized transport system ATPase subunit